MKKRKIACDHFGQEWAGILSSPLREELLSTVSYHRCLVKYLLKYYSAWPWKSPTKFRPDWTIVAFCGHFPNFQTRAWTRRRAQSRRQNAGPSARRFPQKHAAQSPPLLARDLASSWPAVARLDGGQLAVCRVDKNTVQFAREALPWRPPPASGLATAAPSPHTARRPVREPLRNRLRVEALRAPPALRRLWATQSGVFEHEVGARIRGPRVACFPEIWSICPLWGARVGRFWVFGGRALRDAVWAEDLRCCLFLRLVLYWAAVHGVTQGSLTITVHWLLDMTCDRNLVMKQLFDSLRDADENATVEQVEDARCRWTFSPAWASILGVTSWLGWAIQYRQRKVGFVSAFILLCFCATLLRVWTDRDGDKKIEYWGRNRLGAFREDGVRGWERTQQWSAALCRSRAHCGRPTWRQRHSRRRRRRWWRIRARVGEIAQSMRGIWRSGMGSAKGCN